MQSQTRRKQLLAAALAFSWALSSGFLGAVFGFGCYFAHPAHYRSTGAVVISGYASSSAVASDLVSAARGSASVTEAGLVSGLIPHGATGEALARAVARISTALEVTLVHGSVIEVSLTDSDAYRAQQGVEAILRHIEGDAQRAANYPPMRPGAFALAPRRASQPARISGFEPGTCLTLGFIIGVLLDSVLAQLRDARRKLDGGLTLRLVYR